MSSRQGWRSVRQSGPTSLSLDAVDRFKSRKENRTYGSLGRWSLSLEAAELLATKPTFERPNNPQLASPVCSARSALRIEIHFIGQGAQQSARTENSRMLGTSDFHVGLAVVTAHLAKKARKKLKPRREYPI